MFVTKVVISRPGSCWMKIGELFCVNNMTCYHFKIQRILLMAPPLFLICRSLGFSVEWAWLCSVLSLGHLPFCKNTVQSHIWPLTCVPSLHQLAGKYDPQKEEELRLWIEDVTGKRIGENFMESLKDGVLLCEWVFGEKCLNLILNILLPRLLLVMDI